MTTRMLHLPSSGLTIPVTRHSDTPPGQGNPVILIHGWCCRRTDWEGTIHGLSENHDVIALDLPGHGDARDQQPPEWSVPALADVVAEAVTHLGLDNVSLVGHSMGGAVALEAATRLSSVKCVVLVDTFIIPYGDLSEEEARGSEAPFQRDFTGSVKGLVVNSSAPALDADLRRQLQEQMSDANPEQMLPLWGNLLRWQPDQSLQALSARGVTMTAINGEHIPESARERCAPHIQEIVLKGAVHFPQFEVPEAFTAALTQSLK